MTDYIKREDAIDAVMAEGRKVYTSEYANAERIIYEADAVEALSMLPSADAEQVAYICDGRKCENDCYDCFRTLDIEHAKDFKRIGDTYYQNTSAEAVPTVIRAKTFMRKEDFDKWADDIKRQGENVICIPCDAEVVSADAVQVWIPLSHYDDGLGTDFPYERDGEWVIVTDGKTISVERIKKDAYDHFFPNGRWFELEDVIAWMPLQKAYGIMKGGTD